MTAEPIPIRAALNREQRRALDRVDPERAKVLLELVDRVLGRFAHRATIDVSELAELMKWGRSTSYEAVRQGIVPSIRCGNRVVIPLPGLVAVLLGVESGDPRRECSAAGSAGDSGQ